MDVEPNHDGHELTYRHLGFSVRQLEPKQRLNKEINFEQNIFSRVQRAIFLVFGMVGIGWKVLKNIFGLRKSWKIKKKIF